MMAGVADGFVCFSHKKTDAAGADVRCGYLVCLIFLLSLCRYLVRV